MTDINDRGKASEQAFSHEQTRSFLARSMRNQRMAKWLAGEFDLDPDDQDTYAKTITTLGLENQSDEITLKRFSDDVKFHRADISDYLLQRQMDLFYSDAVEELRRK